LTDISEVHTASETSVNFNVTTQRYIPEDIKLPSRRYENLKSHMLLFCSSASSLSYNFSSVGGDGEEGGGELLLGGLGKFTRYLVVVQAFNQVGPGPLSEAVTAQTMEDGEIIIHIQRENRM
jgi:hypothetical protein